MGYMKKMWAEMLLEPQHPSRPPDEKVSIYSQAIDDAIEALEVTQQRGVYADHKSAQCWLALRILKQAKEKVYGLPE